jgi:hypothetical protein
MSPKSVRFEILKHSKKSRLLYHVSESEKINYFLYLMADLMSTSLKFMQAQRWQNLEIQKEYYGSALAEVALYLCFTWL